MKIDFLINNLHNLFHNYKNTPIVNWTFNKKNVIY